MSIIFHYRNENMENYYLRENIFYENLEHWESFYIFGNQYLRILLQGIIF